MDEPPAEQAIEIPPDALSEAALRGVVEAFVLREGTDYGEQEISLERKVLDVLAQIRRGEARIVLAPGDESVTIVLR
jgi:hypothetical protein